jgi:type I restriction enzyme M protein
VCSSDLFIDARKMSVMADRTHRELSEKEIARIATTYHAWRGDKGAGEYGDVPGFCMAAKLDDIRKHGHVLTPGRYVGAEAAEDDDEPFAEKMQRLSAALMAQMKESRALDRKVISVLREIGLNVE